MKKILSVLAIGAAVMTASAQSVEGNKFFDNWSIGLEIGRASCRERVLCSV